MPPRGRLLLHRRRMNNPLEGLALTLGRLPTQKEAWQYMGGPHSAARSAVGVLYRGHRRTLLESFRLGGYGAGEK